MSIDREEQIELFLKYGTPDHVIRHCDAVAKMSEGIALALNRVGYDLDAETVRSAASVHDLMRVYNDHDILGADILEERGHHAEAVLVRYHMRHYPFNDLDSINEQDALCLADRVVMENLYVGIEKRIEYLISKPGVSAERADRIRRVMDYTSLYIESLEERAGITFAGIAAAADLTILNDSPSADDDVPVVKNY